VVMTLVSVSVLVAGFVVVGRFYYYGGWYRLFWGFYWGPYWGPAYGYYFNFGEIKLDTKVKDVQVFINGAYVGTTYENKTMHLCFGSYNIEIWEVGQTHFNQKV